MAENRSRSPARSVCWCVVALFLSALSGWAPEQAPAASFRLSLRGKTAQRSRFVSGRFSSGRADRAWLSALQGAVRGATGLETHVYLHSGPLSRLGSLRADLSISGWTDAEAAEAEASIEALDPVVEYLESRGYSPEAIEGFSSLEAGSERRNAVLREFQQASQFGRRRAAEYARTAAYELKGLDDRASLDAILYTAARMQRTLRALEASYGARAVRGGARAVKAELRSLRAAGVERATLDGLAAMESTAAHLEFASEEAEVVVVGRSDAAEKTPSSLSRILEPAPAERRLVHRIAAELERYYDSYRNQGVVMEATLSQDFMSRPRIMRALARELRPDVADAVRAGRLSLGASMGKLEAVALDLRPIIQAPEAAPPVPGVHADEHRAGGMRGLKIGIVLSGLLLAAVAAAQFVGLSAGFLVVGSIIALAYLFDFLNGMHDAANSVATIVATGVLSPRAAVAWAAFFNFIAFLFFGVQVAGTIGKGLVDPSVVTNTLLIGALAGASLWDYITIRLGIPVSSSHALVGGLAGAAVAKAGFGVLLAPKLIATVAFIFVAPAMGLLLGSLVMLAVRRLFRNRTEKQVDSFFRWGQLFSAALYSLSHGANDAQKTMGIIAVLLFTNGYLGSQFHVPLWVVLSCHAVIALGTLMGGWRIVEAMGHKITKLRRIGGFSAETGAGIGIILASIFGIPVSTTHSITGAIAGVGSTDGLSSVNWRIVARMIWAWFLTIPFAAASAAVVYWLLSAFFS